VVLDVCRELGVSVPGDAVVVGVDYDPNFCDNLRPSLTSVRPDFRRAGRLAVEMLARRMGDPSASPEIVRYSPIGVTSRLSTRRLAVVGKRVADALDLIRREACSGLKAADVVKAMGVTERLAETRFKRAAGRRITEEIAAVRLERVLELLRDPNQDIGPIANMCGWDTDAYLKRLFRSKFGMTMSEWRAKNAGRRA
jgi:LacI family transcriptional regulator